LAWCHSCSGRHQEASDSARRALSVNPRDPVARIIDKAQTREIGNQEAAELIKKYVGKRMFQKVYNQFSYESSDLWGLYNAVTYVASHDNIAQSTSNGLLVKAAGMLEQEISVKGA